MPRQLTSRRASRNGFPCREWVAVVLLVLVGTPATAQQTLPAPPISPETGWQSGHSSWNGDNYETVPTPAPTPAESVELPIELPAEWQENFGLSAPGPSQSVMESVPLSDPGDMQGEVILTDPSGAYADYPLTGDPESLRDLPIGAGLGESAAMEEPPLHEEILSWYEIPWQWIRKGWTNHAELGLNGSHGNSVTSAIQTGLEMRRKTDIYTLGIDFNYRQASTDGRNTESNGRLDVDYDRLLGDSSWTAFGKLGLMYDKFKSFDLRLNMNTGLGYYWIRNDDTNFITRMGAGASREFGAPIDRWTPEAVLGMSLDHQISERQKIIAKLDYFPSLRELGDYRVVADLAWETLIDTAENLSLRLSVTDRYDSTPQGALPNDVYYAALLLYKF
ncbi:DUF481 domain-containing protein [Allorhodopirellula solitaria]|uniref:DUF481 domain-containing protein n=1 Tax=Allorhodopirellula solitaria TaxID=2527987 RepID=A0A5C5XU48_9BACT|nr:DUF481 domain-containing protein [Allorhodopirellula solitaria]TWT65122.1 hypothetical protein CA85_34690 [Allorhodopirellula solitaria]